MTVKSTGRRTIFQQRGANAFLDATHFDFTQSDARVFHLGYLLLTRPARPAGPGLRNRGSSRASRAREAGFKTSVDVVSEDSDRFAGIVRPALRFCDYCVLNEFEAERTTGIEIVREGRIDLGAARKAARELLATGVREWVVIHFPAGAIAVGSGGQELHARKRQLAADANRGDRWRRRRLRRRGALWPARGKADGRRP